MFAGIFKFEDDLLKHYIRTEAWLPLCRNRLDIIRQNSTPKTRRRLRYFTFCAVGAVDVLMLDVANIIGTSKVRGFDTVVFFDKTPEYVVETQKRIPGAIGFPGDFIRIVFESRQRLVPIFSTRKYADSRRMKRQRLVQIGGG